MVNYELKIGIEISYKKIYDFLVKTFSKTNSLLFLVIYVGQIYEIKSIQYHNISLQFLKSLSNIKVNILLNSF